MRTCSKRVAGSRMLNGPCAAARQGSARCDALNSLGYMLADHGQRLDEAVDLVERALKVEPGNPSFLDSLGWAYYQQGKLDRSDPRLTEAAAKVPASSVIQDHLGDLRFKQQRYADAAAAWERRLRATASRSIAPRSKGRCGTRNRGSGGSRWPSAAARRSLVRAAYLAALWSVAGCGGAPRVLPARRPCRSFPQFTTAYAEATGDCASVKTLSASINLSAAPAAQRSRPE